MTCGADRGGFSRLDRFPIVSADRAIRRISCLPLGGVRQLHDYAWVRFGAELTRIMEEHRHAQGRRETLTSRDMKTNTFTPVGETSLHEIWRNTVDSDSVTEQMSRSPQECQRIGPRSQLKTVQPATTQRPFIAECRKKTHHLSLLPTSTWPRLTECRTFSMDQPLLACTGFKAIHPLAKTVSDSRPSRAIPSRPVAWR